MLGTAAGCWQMRDRMRRALSSLLPISKQLNKGIIHELGMIQSIQHLSI